MHYYKSKPDLLSKCQYEVLANELNQMNKEYCDLVTSELKNISDQIHQLREIHYRMVDRLESLEGRIYLLESKD